jgi:hypothetical protein
MLIDFNLKDGSRAKVEKEVGETKDGKKVCLLLNCDRTQSSSRACFFELLQNSMIKDSKRWGGSLTI